MAARIVLNPFPISPQPTILQDDFEVIGLLDKVEAYGDGLVYVRIAGFDKLVSEDLEGKLRKMIGKHVSILRLGDRWSAAGDDQAAEEEEAKSKAAAEAAAIAEAEAYEDEPIEEPEEDQ